MPFTPSAVLFDLDGTLLDTAPDLAAALNYTRAQRDLPPLPLKQIRPVSSDGAKGLLQCGFGIDETHAVFNELRKILLDYYQMHIANHTILFSGMEKILHDLEKQKIPWGIITNKPGALTEKLLEQLQLSQRAACIVSGDTLLERKPHPAPLLYAAKQLNLPASQCCYVGDALRDMQAAKQATMFSIGALYGYLHVDEDLQTWEADVYIHSPQELKKVLKI